MSIIKGVFTTPQHPDGVKPLVQGMASVGQPADPRFQEYFDAVPVTLLRAYRFSWQGERIYLRKGAQVYLLSWPDATYRLVEAPRSVHHFDTEPTEGVDFTF